MVDRFVQFSTSIVEIYKYLQKLERIGMERFNLKGSHTQCLIMINRHPDGITSAQLGALCGTDKAAISRTVADLESIGHIRRVSESGNAYQAKIMLTPSGREAAEKMDITISRVVERAGEGLSDEQRCVFYSTLSLISENMKKIYLEGDL